MKVSIALLAALFLGTAAAFVSYADHQVIRVVPVDEEQVKVLDSLYESAGELSGINFWTEPHAPGTPVDVMVSPNMREEFAAFLRRAGMGSSVMIENLEPFVNATMQPASNDEDYFAKYHTYEETVKWYTDLVNQHSNIAKLVKVGSTFEGADIIAVHISTGGSGSRRAFFIDGGLHAREWISPATVQYILHALLTSDDAAVKNARDTLDWYVLPLWNIDGYRYTWNGDRMWRKTRKPNKGSSCVGTDPNRNFDMAWDTPGGADTNPCSDAYRGTAPNSEIEVKTVSEFIKNTKNIHGYINFHAYSQLWMSPWGYTTDLSTDKDYNAQTAAGQAAAAALKKVHGTSFQVGAISKIIYKASGSTADYFYGVCGIKYSYGVELRDTGRYGFVLPPAQIIPSGQETLPAVLALADFIAKDTSLTRN